MQIFIYETADNSLHLSKIQKSEGDGIQLVFPQITEGICCLGTESTAIKANRACFSKGAWRRGVYPVTIRASEGTLQGDALRFEEGMWRSESSEEMCVALLEIARLKDRMRKLSSEIENLNQAVFRTAIF